MRVLRARGAELEREFAFGVVRQLFEPALADASEPERAELLQGRGRDGGELCSGCPARRRGSTRTRRPAVARSRSCTASTGCARTSPPTRPLCIAVDDAHWADAPSLRFLAFLLTRLEELPRRARCRQRGRASRAPMPSCSRALTTDPSAEVIRLAAADAGRRRASSSSRGSARARSGLRRRLPASDARRRRFSCASSSTRCATKASLPTPRRPRARRADRRAHGRRARSASGSTGCPSTPGGSPARSRSSSRATCCRPRGSPSSTLNAAAEAADLLATAGIVDAGRPLTFVHPIVRSGIYVELSLAERAAGPPARGRLLAEQPGTHEQVAEHLLASEPAGDPWVVERLVGAARAADANGRSRVGAASPAPSACRAATSPRPAGDCCSSSEWRRRAPGSPAGSSICSGPQTRRRCRGCRRSGAGAGAGAQPRPVAIRRLWRCSIAPRQRSPPAERELAGDARGRGRNRRDESPRDRALDGRSPSRAAPSAPTATRARRLRCWLQLR